MQVHRTNILKIITASLSGLAGGATIASFLGLPGMIAGSIAGGAITGFTEYMREKSTGSKQQSSPQS